MGGFLLACCAKDVGEAREGIFEYSSRGRTKMDLTIAFAGSARGYPIGRGLVEVRGPCSQIRRILRDGEWHRLKLNGLATHWYMSQNCAEHVVPVAVRSVRWLAVANTARGVN
jgi:hypothetical protein